MRTMFLKAPGLFHFQFRNHFILKRRNPLPLYRKEDKPRQLYGRHYVYDLVEDTVCRQQPKINLILTKYVEGIGDVGDVVSAKEKMAYNKFLLPQLAVYASPENVRKYKCENAEVKNIDVYNSTFLQNTIKSISDKLLMVFMSDKSPWTLEAKHISMFYRMAGFYVNPESIELPSEPITGPVPQSKTLDFQIQIQVSENTKISATCRVYNWNKDSLDDLTAITKENYVN